MSLTQRNGTNLHDWLRQIVPEIEGLTGTDLADAVAQINRESYQQGTKDIKELFK